MGAVKISAADMKSLRTVAKRYVAKGMSASEAMRKAVDAEIEETQGHLDSVKEQAKPKGSRDIHTSFL